MKKLKSIVFVFNYPQKKYNFYKKVILIAGLLFVSELEAQKDSISKSQSPLINAVVPKVVNVDDSFMDIVIDTQPEFIGGQLALYKFISENLNYPDQNCVEGKVFVGFTIDSTGNIKNIEIKRGFKGLPKYNEEAIRVVKLTSGKWKPATRLGKPIEVQYILLIRFKLE